MNEISPAEGQGRAGQVEAARGGPNEGRLWGASAPTAKRGTSVVGCRAAAGIDFAAADSIAQRTAARWGPQWLWGHNNRRRRGAAAAVVRGRHLPEERAHGLLRALPR